MQFLKCLIIKGFRRELLKKRKFNWNVGSKKKRITSIKLKKNMVTLTIFYA